MVEQSDRKRGRCEEEEEEEEVGVVEVKRVREEIKDVQLFSTLKEDLLENIEDVELCSTTADLDSFMKSFEEEISLVPLTETVLEAEGEESVLDLGYLLEASDDELGLPPSTASPSNLGEEEVAELVQVSSDSGGGSSELSELWGFEENVTGYDSFDLGAGNEYVALDGLFDFGGPDFVCRPETLPAQ